MCSADSGSVLHCLSKVAGHVATTRAAGPHYKCPHCGHRGLRAEALVSHNAMFHVYEPNRPAVCPICGEHAPNIAVHLHHKHGPEAQHGGHAGRPNIRLHAFALVVVRRKSDGKFLLVQEFAAQVRTLCAWPCGRVAVWLWLWLCGCVAVAVAVWPCGCGRVVVAVWLCDRVAVWLWLCVVPVASTRNVLS